MVGAVFANQAAGLIVGPLIASICLASGLSDNLTWRLLLGLGAIPGLAVFYLRREIHETPRFAVAGGATEEAAAAIAAATGKAAGSTGESRTRSHRAAGAAAQLSPGVWMSTQSTDGYFCRHCSSRASCALLALSTR
jgi:PHS family inorganic phosphate transporter-like MFS transporter